MPADSASASWLNLLEYLVFWIFSPTRTRSFITLLQPEHQKGSTEHIPQSTAGICGYGRQCLDGGVY